jgi:hypothetical protein
MRYRFAALAASARALSCCLGFGAGTTVSPWSWCWLCESELFELTLLPRRKRWDRLCKKGEWLEGDGPESAEERARGEADDGGKTDGSEAIGTLTAAATMSDWMGLDLTQDASGPGCPSSGPELCWGGGSGQTRRAAWQYSERETIDLDAEKVKRCPRVEQVK